ncbi:hypothetical protein GCM10022226_47750 [Sphaerisporangium flaviroseum]|uniref:Uncharacterized protein n=1 Tax=Sphaerisporangium flaviroseum TaxID=509199 RepID=A0ABP7IM34_9ACTN
MPRRDEADSRVYPEPLFVRRKDLGVEEGAGRENQGVWESQEAVLGAESGRIERDVLDERHRGAEDGSDLAEPLEHGVPSKSGGSDEHL